MLERLTVHHRNSHVRFAGDYVRIGDYFQTGADFEENFLIVECLTENQFVTFYTDVNK